MEAEIKQLAAQLADTGVKYAFGITGSGASWALITELEGRGIRYHPASHEASAVLMAGGSCALSDALGLAVTIKGPGLANALPGIAHNRFEHRPVLTISEAYPDTASSHVVHKRLDHLGLVRPLAKGMLSLDQAWDHLQELLEAASAEPRGPVHLDLSLNNHGVAWFLEAPSRRGSVDLEAALARVAKASRPIVITGALSLRRGWREILGRLRIPVFTTAAAKGAIDETLPHACGVYTGVGKHLTAEALLLPQADMVLGIGLRADEVLRPGFGATTALLIDEVDMAYSGSAAEGRILADEAATEAILGGLQRCEWGLEAIAGIKARQRQVLLGERWLPAAAFEVLNTALSFPYAMVMDTGQFCTIGEHCWLASPDRPYLGASNSRGMGAGLPSAIGLAISETPRPVICVVGDGGMPAYPGELRLAVEQALPLCVILMTDGCFGSIVNAPIDQVQSSRRAVSVPGSSWWRIASAMGCEAHQVASSEALAEVLTDWRRASPLFIEATFPQASYAVMARDLR